jgi:hypothetical protein
MLACAQQGIDLRARAERQHDMHAERCEQVEIVAQGDELTVGEHLAAAGDDERAAAEGMDVRRSRAAPLDEVDSRPRRCSVRIQMPLPIHVR